MRILNKKIWPYQITLPRLINPGLLTWDERTDWLRDNLSKNDWYILGSSTHPQYYFKQEKDYLMFVLRWS